MGRHAPALSRHNSGIGKRWLDAVSRDEPDGSARPAALLAGTAGDACPGPGLSLALLPPRRTFRRSASLCLVVQTAQRQHRIGIAANLRRTPRHHSCSYGARHVQLRRQCRRRAPRMSRRHATRSQRHWKAYRWRRSVDIRRALSGSVRAAPDSRPEHDAAASICGRLSARRSEYGAHKMRSRRRRRQHIFHIDGKRARPRR